MFSKYIWLRLGKCQTNNRIRGKCFSFTEIQITSSACGKNHTARAESQVDGGFHLWSLIHPVTHPYNTFLWLYLVMVLELGTLKSLKELLTSQPMFSFNRCFWSEFYIAVHICHVSSQLNIYSTLPHYNFRMTKAWKY